MVCLNIFFEFECVTEQFADNELIAESLSGSTKHQIF